MAPMEVTLFDLELNIVGRETVTCPPPAVLKRPRFVRPTAFFTSEADPPTVDWVAVVFRYQGMGIYRQTP